MPYLQRDGSRFHYHLDDYTEPRQAKSVVLTLDSDFRVYRKDRRHVIPTLMPPTP